MTKTDEPEIDPKLERERNIAEIRKAIEKKFGKGVSTPADKLRTEMDRIPTGIFVLDYALNGGFPTGRVCMIKGKKSASKTTLALRIVASAQKMCSSCWGYPECVCGSNRKTFCAWMDQEGTLDINWAKIMGVNLSELEVQRPVTAEETIDVSDLWLNSGELDLLIVDSIAAMTPIEELEKTAEKNIMGTHAKLINSAMRRWVSAQNYCRKTFNRIPTIILINQVRYKVGVMFGNPETNPGGEGQKFATSVDVDLWAKKYEMDTDTGKPLNAGFGFRVSKNKTSPANMAGEFIMALSETETKKVGDICDEKFIVDESEKSGLLVKESPRKYI
jgi:recombination protein RecA